MNQSHRPSGRLPYRVPLPRPCRAERPCGKESPADDVGNTLSGPLISRELGCDTWVSTSPACSELPPLTEGSPNDRIPTSCLVFERIGGRPICLSAMSFAAFSAASHRFFNCGHRSASVSFINCGEAAIHESKNTISRRRSNWDKPCRYFTTPPRKLGGQTLFLLLS